ncbi:hypothetical protein PHAMO_380091 [Magnetospirillum molischianum DSM 120]|uniref:Uncharacterized protein n=1 Tax=Magnetospirillum molischianum DSM 120 TaxID=1150626 RepID=H8FVN5_MAGML|nr:hypothetical protein PHAMO_380091 [Magnetospirillum molischianum DSM 120]
MVFGAAIPAYPLKDLSSEYGWNRLCEAVDATAPLPEDNAVYVIRLLQVIAYTLGKFKV